MPTPDTSPRRCRPRSTIGSGSSRRLRNLATDLEHGAIPRERFHEREAAAPLPRAYQWADGSAYVNHVALVRQARGAEMPDSFWHDPLMYQGGSDGFLGPARRHPAGRRSLGLRSGGRSGGGHRRRAAGRVARRRAGPRVRLVGLTNDVSLRNLIPGELAKGFGFFQSKPASSFSPVFVTPDALGRPLGGRQANGRARSRSQRRSRSAGPKRART